MIWCLAPNTEPYVFDTGDVKQLINLEGTIPIIHKHQTLNISVKVTRHWPKLPHRYCNPLLTRSGLGWTTQSRHLFATLFPPRTQNFPSHPTSTILVSLRGKKIVKYFIYLFSRTNRASLYGWVEPQKYRPEYIPTNSKVMWIWYQPNHYNFYTYW